jgi:hypothetical protein
MSCTSLTRAAGFLLASTGLMGSMAIAYYPAKSQQQPASKSDAADDIPKPASRQTMDRTEAGCRAELIAAARIEIGARIKEFNAGREAAEPLCDASRRLAKAELEKTSNKADRILILEWELMGMLENEKLTKLRFAAGMIPVQDYEVAHYYRCEVELNLLREKKKP